MSHHSRFQFILFRFILGIYLANHFFDLIPDALHLFSHKGMLPTTTQIPTWGIIPFYEIKTETGLIAMLLILIMVAVCLAMGIGQKLSAFILWYGWSYLQNRNVLIANPGIPYVGWLLLACACIPDPKHIHWTMPPLIFWSAWVIMATGYTVSGLHKLQTESWVNGTALHHVFHSLLARESGLRNLILAAPPIFLQITTWASLALELLFLPIGVFDRMRMIFWVSFMMMHLGILALINFTDLSLGMMMIHLFTFDYHWIQSDYRV